jgi:hypothetical protein
VFRRRRGREKNMMHPKGHNNFLATDSKENNIGKMSSKICKRLGKT